MVVATAAAGAHDRAGRHHRDDRAEQHEAEQQRVAEAGPVGPGRGEQVGAHAAAAARSTGGPGSVTTTRVSSPRAATSAAKECGGSTSSRRIRRRSGDGHRRQAGDGERAPVHGDGDPRADQRDRVGGGHRVEVTRAEVGAPAPDRQQRDVDRALGQHRHAVEQAGVAAGVDGAAAALEQVAERLGGRPVGEPRAPAVAAVLGADGGDPQVAVGDRLAGRQLVDPREAAAAQPGAGAAGHDDPACGADGAQRRQVQVVAVQVADQDDVDAGPGGGVGQRHDAAQQPDGVGQQGVGEHGAPGQLDADGRVAQEVQVRARHAASIGRAPAVRSDCRAIRRTLRAGMAA